MSSSLFASLTQRWHEHSHTRANEPAVGDVGAGPEEAWTWHQLRLQAQQCQQQLIKIGVTPRMRVALSAPRSKHTVAWLWACWEQGLTVVLLQQTPPERYEKLLQQSQAHAVWDGQSLQVLDLTHPLQSNEAAYIIYTSGSTGTPKGVEVGPRGLPLVWQEQVRLFTITPQSQCAWMLSPAFDASLSDIGVSLYAGACLWVVPEKRWLRYRSWCQDMDTYQITHLDAPPSWLNAFHHLPPPTSLQVIIAGGEPTPPAILKAWSPLVRWVNVYGPTEATICTSANIRTASNTHPTLGQPFMHVLYALHHDGELHHQLTPGEEGELWIGGHAVALGYTDPHLTQERFVQQDQTRWFKTGDWVRWDGQDWLYLGRIDRQIKRHGVLVNLGEIEQCLLMHEHVYDVYVEEQEGVLIAYVRGLDSWANAEASAQLRSWLEPKLNPQARPQQYVCVSSWPTLNGKVHKEALRAMVVQH